MKHYFLISSMNFQFKSLIFEGRFDWETIIMILPSLYRFSDSWKSFYFSWFVSIIRLIFLSNYRYDFRDQRHHQKLSISAGLFNQLFLFWFIHITRDSPMTPKSGNYFGFDQFSSFNFQSLPVRFLNENFNRKHSTYILVFNWKINVFLPWIGAPIVRNVQWERLEFNFSRLSNSYFIKTTCYISSIMVGIEN